MSCCNRCIDYQSFSSQTANTTVIVQQPVAMVPQNTVMVTHQGQAYPQPNAPPAYSQQQPDQGYQTKQTYDSTPASPARRCPQNKISTRWQTTMTTTREYITSVICGRLKSRRNTLTLLCVTLFFKKNFTLGLRLDVRSYFEDFSLDCS